MPFPFVGEQPLDRSLGETLDSADAWSPNTFPQSQGQNSPFIDALVNGALDNSDQVLLHPNESESVKAKGYTYRCQAKLSNASLGRCLDYVKTALVRSCVLPSKPGNPSSAKDSHAMLISAGYELVGRSKGLSMPGDIVVYGSMGGHPHGHIEIKGQQGFISDFVSKGGAGMPVSGVYRLRPEARQRLDMMHQSGLCANRNPPERRGP